MACETLKPSIRSSPWIRGHTPEKVLTGHLCDQLADFMETLGRAPRQRPRSYIAKATHQPSRRQRKTVSGWTMIRLSRHCGHQRENNIQNSRSQRRKHRRVWVPPVWKASRHCVGQEPADGYRSDSGKASRIRKAAATARSAKALPRYSLGVEPTAAFESLMHQPINCCSHD